MEKNYLQKKIWEDFLIRRQQGREKWKKIICKIFLGKILLNKNEKIICS